MKINVLVVFLPGFVNGLHLPGGRPGDEFLITPGKFPAPPGRNPGPGLCPGVNTSFIPCFFFFPEEERKAKGCNGRIETGSPVGIIGFA